MKSIVFKLLKTILPLCLGVYLVWYFFNAMDQKTKEYFYSVIQRADYRWIIASLILSIFAFFSRAYRWKFMLEPLGYKTSFWNRYHSIMIGYIINLTIPRAGEASRAAMLLKSDGVPFAKSFGTIIAERAVDFFMLLIVAGTTALFGTQNFVSIFHEIETKLGVKPEASAGMPSWKIGIIIFICLCSLIAFLILYFKPEIRKKLVGIIKDLSEGILSIFKCKNPLAYIFHTCAIWILYITYFGICFLALDETKDFPLSGILLGFIAGSIGIIFTNGGVGAFPLLIGLVVNLILGDKTPNALAIGNAIGMIIWVSQTGILILLGLLSLFLIPKNFNKEHVAP
jgi:hypothetical protein